VQVTAYGRQNVPDRGMVTVRYVTHYKTLGLQSYHWNCWT